MEPSFFTNPIKQKLKTNTVSIGSWIQIPHPVIAETMSNTGFEWLTFDCEHGEMNSVAFANTVRGIKNREIVPFVRVRQNSVLDIRQALDGGAYGVFVPLINDAQSARQAVAAAKYPPEGVRGFAYTRANRHGLLFSEYADRANQEIAVIAMIETRDAVERIDEIVAVDGIDGVFIGPYDLSGSYGIPGALTDERVVSACHKIVSAARQKDKAAGIHLVHATSDAVANAINDGYTLLALGMDTVFLTEGSKAAVTMTQITAGDKK